MGEPRRLNWGAGPDWAQHHNWTASDRDDFNQEHVGDLLAGLPWPDGTFAYAVTNHALQMVRYVDLVAALAELRRVLVDDGWLRILVPDVMAAVQAWARGDLNWFPIVEQAETSIDGKLCAYATWYSEARSVFTPRWLVELCGRAGFTDAAPVAWGETLSAHAGITDLDSRPYESLVVEARR